jgi:hypothetical protein
MHNAVRTTCAQIPQRGTIMPQGASGILVKTHDDWVNELSADVALLDDYFVHWPNWGGPQPGTLGQTPWDQTKFPKLNALLGNIQQALADFQGLPPVDSGPPSDPFPDDGTTNENPHKMIVRYLCQFVLEANRRYNGPSSTDPGVAPDPDKKYGYDFPSPAYQPWADYARLCLVNGAILVGNIRGRNTAGFNPPFPSYLDEKVMSTLATITKQMCTWA